jgi:hypothetical protein
MRNPDRMPAITEAMLGDRGLDVIVVTAGSMNAGAPQIADSVAAASTTAQKPCAVFWPHGRADARDRLWQAGVPCFPNESDLRLWLTCGRRHQPGPPAEEQSADPVASPAAAALRRELLAGRPVAEPAAKRIMQILGFEIPHGVLVTGPPLALARSLDREHDGALPEALAELTVEFANNAEEVAEIEYLLPDAVRLATETGDLGTAQSIADQAVTLAADSETPHRQAAALYCRGVLDHDGARLLAAAQRYRDAGRPLFSARALEAAGRAFIRADDRGQARPAFTRAVEIYTSLGADTDVARLRR